MRHLISATQCAEVAPAADKASDSDDIDLFASDDDDAPVTKPKLVKPAPRPPPSSQQQQEVSKKQAKKAAKTEKKSAAKAAKQQAAAAEEDEDMEVLDETSLYFIPQREANCSDA